MIKGAFASNTVAMVTCCVTKMITCPPIVGQFFDTMIVASSDNTLVIGFPEGGGGGPRADVGTLRIVHFKVVVFPHPWGSFFLQSPQYF